MIVVLLGGSGSGGFELGVPARLMVSFPSAASLKVPVRV
jgi:hypothetical protein